MQESDKDILLILDTSYSGAAFYRSNKGVGVFEILAAGSKNSHVPMPGKWSFTNALVEALGKQQDDTFTVVQLHSLLLSSSLKVQPMYMSLTARHGSSIRLSALQNTSKPVPRTIFIHISLNYPVLIGDLHAWKLWITRWPPANIDKLEVLTDPSQKPSQHQNHAEFFLRVFLQDSLIPESKSWKEWLANVPQNVRKLDVAIEPSGNLVVSPARREPHGSNPIVAQATDVVDTLVAQLNLDIELRNALSYTKVTVLPFMWGKPLLSRQSHSSEDWVKNYEWEHNQIKTEMENIGEVFRRRFKYNVQPIFEIPDSYDNSECQQMLRLEIQSHLSSHETLYRPTNNGDSKNARRASLLIIVYGGHGVDTRMMNDKYLVSDSDYLNVKDGHNVWAS